MTDQGRALNDINRALAGHRLTLFVGAGVTAAASADVSGKPPAIASWTGLIDHGINRCVSDGFRDAQWADHAKADARSAHVVDVIAAAEKLTGALGGRHGHKFSAWLTDTVGTLKATNTDLLDRLKKLSEAGALIATTNYDLILTDHLGLLPVTWRNPGGCQEATRNVDRVVHIHGHYQEPQSIVFGASSYADVVRDEAAAAFLRTALYSTTILFVGFGAGMSDPNFRAVRAWLKVAAKGSVYQHYVLCRNGDIAALAAAFSDEPLRPLGFGDDYSDLPAFLDTITVDGSQRSTRSLIDAGPPPQTSDGVLVGTPVAPRPADAVTIKRLKSSAGLLRNAQDEADSEPTHASTRHDLIRLLVDDYGDAIDEVLAVAAQADVQPAARSTQAVEVATMLLNLIETIEPKP